MESTQKAMVFSKYGRDLVKCGHCSKDYNSKFKYCPFCGEQAAEESSLTDLQCPHCNVIMDKVMEIESIIDHCPECGGVWCEGHELEEITRERDVFLRDDISRKFIKKRPENVVKYIKCPICNQEMNRMNFGKISGIIVDVCSDHGIWLDSGELEEIRAFIANGGIDKAQNKEILENRVAIEEASRNAKEAMFFIRRINKYNLKRISIDGF